MSEVVEKDAVGPSNRTLPVVLPMPVRPTTDLSDLYSCAIFLDCSILTVRHDQPY